MGSIGETSPKIVIGWVAD